MNRRTTRPGLALLVGMTILAAAPTVAADGLLWSIRDDGFRQNDMAHSISVGDNVVVAAGYFGGSTDFDDAVAKGFSTSGAPLWTLVVNGVFGEDDIFFRAGYDNASRSFYLFGYTTVDGQGNTEGLILKVAADNGDVLWRRAFLPSGYKRMEWNPALAVHDGKAFIAATVTRDLPEGGEDKDIYVASLGPDNTVNWEATADPFGGMDDHSAVGSAPDGLLVLGTVSNSTDNNAMFLRKYDYDNGEALWTAFLHETGPGGVPGMRNAAGGIAVAGGKVFVTGALNAPGTDDRQATVASLDAATGAERWRLRIGTPSIEETARMATLVATGGGDVFIAGTQFVPPDSSEIFVAAVRDDNTAGTFLWDRALRGPNTSNYVPGFLAFEAGASRLLLGAAFLPAGGGVPRMSLRVLRTDNGGDDGLVTVPGGGAKQGDRVAAGALDGTGGAYIAGFLATDTTAEDLALARIVPVTLPPVESGGGGGLCMAVQGDNRSSFWSLGGWGLLFSPLAVLLAGRSWRRYRLKTRCNF